ncbi:hypothetical protein FB45DRAFT_141173 [Roridomyces roridus]|uniref:Uncharacterized protein n=1 Tax=Roridomyces roridus TaxID=1738132 RepID=A0AAD7BIA4_9AGAR|nr:hypothetical protein FB45DRAFT_141173 [Roridomyces roridus]
MLFVQFKSTITDAPVSHPGKETAQDAINPRLVLQLFGQHFESLIDEKLKQRSGRPQQLTGADSDGNGETARGPSNQAKKHKSAEPRGIFSEPLPQDTFQKKRSDASDRHRHPKKNPAVVEPAPRKQSSGRHRAAASEKAASMGSRTKSATNEGRDFRGNDTLGYRAAIIDIGKSFVLKYAWLDVDHFGPVPTEVPATSAALFLAASKAFSDGNAKGEAKEPRDLRRWVRNTIFKHVPKIWHCLVDPQDHAHFFYNFEHQFKAQRHQTVKKARERWSEILQTHGLIKNAQDRDGFKRLLAFNPSKKNVLLDRFPPLLFKDGKSSNRGALISWPLAMFARFALFGEKGYREPNSKPSGRAVGFKWKVRKILIHAMAFFINTVEQVTHSSASGHKEHFEAEGQLTLINWKARYLDILFFIHSFSEKFPQLFKEAIEFWEGVVFKGFRIPLAPMCSLLPETPKVTWTASLTRWPSETPPPAKKRTTVRIWKRTKALSKAATASRKKRTKASSKAARGVEEQTRLCRKSSKEKRRLPRRQAPSRILLNCEENWMKILSRYSASSPCRSPRQSPENGRLSRPHGLFRKRPSALSAIRKSTSTRRCWAPAIVFRSSQAPLASRTRVSRTRVSRTRVSRRGSAGRGSAEADRAEGK